MNLFKDIYGILALAAAKEVIQEKNHNEIYEFWGNLESVSHASIEENNCVCFKKSHTISV